LTSWGEKKPGAKKYLLCERGGTLGRNIVKINVGFNTSGRIAVFDDAEATYFCRI
jgi:hypothetical protein